MSIPALLVDEMRLTQIEFPLDPAPRLVLTACRFEKKIVDLLPLGGDQLKFDLVVELGELSVSVVTVVSVLDVLEPVALIAAKRAPDRPSR